MARVFSGPAPIRHPRESGIGFFVSALHEKRDSRFRGNDLKWAMLTFLYCAPASGDTGLSPIQVLVERTSGAGLTIRYLVTGHLDKIVLPPPVMPRRSHSLWEATCFEAFLRNQDGSYIEFNFSPSGEWAAYRFTGYRDGMAEAPMATPPHIRTTQSAEQLQVEVELQFPSLSDATSMNLAAVILSGSGERSFWAAKHPEGEPDFHHPGCFIEQLPAAPRP